MDRLRGWLRRMRTWLFRGEAERELREELRLHVELETAAAMNRGLSEGAARQAALLSFGGEDRYAEEARDARGLGVLAQTWRRRFAASRSVLGQVLVLDDRPATVVGVLPAEADLGIVMRRVV